MGTETERGVTTRLATSPAILGTLDSYAAHLAGRKLRPRAIETYVKTLRRYAIWMGDESTVAIVDAESIGRYQIARDDKAAATIAKDLSAIRSYCRWCIRVKLRTDDPTLDLEWPKRIEPIPRALKLREMRLLDQVLDMPLPALDPKARYVIARNKRAILLMWYAGLRVSEVPALDWRDVDVDEGTLTVRDGKGGKDRTVGLHPRLVENLLETPTNKQVGAVCGHRNGKQMSYKSMPHIFGPRYLGSFGLDISAHMLRHTFAVQLLKADANIRVIQDMMGHASLATTQRYLALDLDDKKKAINKLPYRY